LSKESRQKIYRADNLSALLITSFIWSYLDS